MILVRAIASAMLSCFCVALVVGWRTLPSTRERPQRIVMDGRGIALITVLVGASLVAVAA